jgi:hypothetical protein
MSKHETPMTRWYWQQVGGTLIEEFLAVSGSESCGQRLIDGVIVLGGEKRIAKKGDVSLEGKHIVVVQAKAKRLGMNLMGQALFSAVLMKKFKPASIRSVALCAKTDSVLAPILESYRGVEVVVCDSVGPVNEGRRSG